ncbi:hypothetical protein [Kitasatospora sp. NPDC006786]|uniref:hypothetical protein n=1 Tax=unclassified Kitasatospora TaxID=2633591 RepID=UPI0033702FD6
MRAIAGMMTAAVVMGLLLGGAVSLLLFAFTDWFDPIARWVHVHGFFLWAHGTP